MVAGPFDRQNCPIGKRPVCILVSSFEVPIRGSGGDGILGSTASAIDARNVSKVFKGAGQDEVRALDNVSVAIRENEFFTLLGPSGCGKTTLLRLIAGFDFPTEGEILLYGDDIALLPPYKRPVNTVFQNYALFPHMTVAQNMMFCATVMCGNNA